MEAQPPNQHETQVQVEVCDTHGLKYNAAVDSGCARCRSESSERTVSHGPAAVRRSGSDPKRGLVIAAALVAVVACALYAANLVAYRAVDGLLDVAFEGELDEPGLPVDGDEDLSFEELMEQIERESKAEGNPNDF